MMMTMLARTLPVNKGAKNMKTCRSSCRPSLVAPVQTELEERLLDLARAREPYSSEMMAMRQERGLAQLRSKEEQDWVSELRDQMNIGVDSFLVMTLHVLTSSIVIQSWSSNT